jgi:hypothetical protein
MTTIDEQKIKLEQKKNRIAIEEVRLREKERKARTRRLIEIGGLIVKADLDYLPNNTLYGALLSVAEELENKGAEIKATWSIKGNKAFNDENKNVTAIIVKFTREPLAQVKKIIRNLGLKYNSLRKEWYGYVRDINELKRYLKDDEHNIEYID